MSARLGCVNCGNAELRVACGTSAATGKRLALQACPCGYLVVMSLGAEQVAANLAVLAESGVEVKELPA